MRLAGKATIVTEGGGVPIETPLLMDSLLEDEATR